MSEILYDMLLDWNTIDIKRLIQESITTKNRYAYILFDAVTSICRDKMKHVQK